MAFKLCPSFLKDCVHSRSLHKERQAFESLRTVRRFWTQSLAMFVHRQDHMVIGWWFRIFEQRYAPFSRSGKCESPCPGIAILQPRCPIPGCTIPRFVEGPTHSLALVLSYRSPAAGLHHEEKPVRERPLCWRVPRLLIVGSNFFAGGCRKNVNACLDAFS